MPNPGITSGVGVIGGGVKQKTLEPEHIPSLDDHTMI